MNDLESSSLVTPDSRRMPNVARLTLERSVFEDNVRSLEYSDGKRVRSVLADGLEQARKERRADDLELECFWISNPDGALAVVFSVHPVKVFFV